MIELANINMVTQGWITGVIDKLEELSYVRRERSETDRRVININITPSVEKCFVLLISGASDIIIIVQESTISIIRNISL